MFRYLSFVFFSFTCTVGNGGVQLLKPETVNVSPINIEQLLQDELFKIGSFEAHSGTSQDLDSQTLAIDLEGMDSLMKLSPLPEFQPIAKVESLNAYSGTGKQSEDWKTVAIMIALVYMIYVLLLIKGRTLIEYIFSCNENRRKY